MISNGEQKVLSVLGKDFTELLYEQAPAIIQAAVEIANKAGYDPAYLPYLFFVLFERRRDWPRLSKRDHGALSVLVNIMSAAGKIPKYRSNLTPPDDSNERVLDTVLKKLAIWAQTKMVAPIMRGYQVLLKKYAKAWLAASDYTPPDKAMGVLKYMFEESLRELAIHSNSTLMNNVTRFIL